MRLVLAVVLAVSGAVGYVLAMLRWLRVIQREHYEAGSVTRFFVRWAWPKLARAEQRSLRRPLPFTYGALAAVVVLLALSWAEGAFAVASLSALVLPWGLSVHGRTGALAWTRRLRTLCVTACVLAAALFAALATLWSWWASGTVVIVFVPLWIDLAAWLNVPYENHLANKFVATAARRLATIAPRVVAITGSYGKTSTKQHLAELLGGRHGVVPSPRSYNNRAGLSRAINENLSDGTKIFIAEMGTYGPGEISELCAWCVPEISVITAIGPVHLERMGSLDVIEAAKYEITERARVVVLNVDDERLAKWPDRLIAAHKRVRTAGSHNDAAQVRVETVAERWRITIDGVVVGIAPPVIGIHEANLACAIAAALELGVSNEEILARLAHLSAVANRMVVATAPSGVMVIDDTFNANPAGAASALATLAALPINGKRVVVTPGIIEMGQQQAEANRDLARAVAQAGASLMVVGRTNARELLEGYGANALRVNVRDEAVEWVRANLGAGDGVLYLNDLPDQYP